MPECLIEGCIRPAFRTGLCTKHYAAARPACTIEGCGKPQHASGLCDRHYRAQIAVTAARCSVDGCERPAIADGFCEAHYRRKLRHGSADPTRPHDWGGRKSHPLYQSWLWLRRRRGRISVASEWVDDFWRFVGDMGERPTSRHVLARKDGALAYGPQNCFWREPNGDPIESRDRADYMKKYLREYRARDPERFRAYSLRKRHKITPEEWDRIHAKQGGACAICGAQETSVQIVG